MTPRGPQPRSIALSPGRRPARSSSSQLSGPSSSAWRCRRALSSLLLPSAYTAFGSISAPPTSASPATLPPAPPRLDWATLRPPVGITAGYLNSQTPARAHDREPASARSNARGRRAWGERPRRARPGRYVSRPSDRKFTRGVSQKAQMRHNHRRNGSNTEVAPGGRAPIGAACRRRRDRRSRRERGRVQPPDGAACACSSARRL